MRGLLLRLSVEGAAAMAKLRSRGPAREAATPFSIRLTKSEKAALQERAAGVPLGVYVRSRLLGEEVAGRSVAQVPIKDGELFARVLALLGQSGLAPSLSQLAAQASAGALYLDDATKAQLKQACDDVLAMRALLLEALGKHVFDQIRRPRQLAFGFNGAARPEGDQ